ncbi:peptidoglycan/LPS O-acetylase OafA/YrhL [Mesorhizobium loti]|uniref:Peptidoglycan/LPS O-acetylase OafA/YrhL n=1 Tax=Rhizobium loti TaxID=381 RepID=A0A8E2WF95_RHILI|nr:acyltransferase [Mesorhizobium loti]PWJ92732.1 peptidoglycan/LPS O-acetylase OafA/YrhL [Mesorhizobium loti]
MIANIQVMRGVAALMVVLAHLSLARGGMGLDTFYPRYWWFGPSGVDIFFVISGFVVTTSAVNHGRNSTTRWRTACSFALKRVVRIYPVYWVALATAVAVMPPVGSAVGGLPERSMIAKIFLATPFNDFIALSWSLCFEMWFYVVLTGILIVAPKKVYFALSVWAALTLAIVLYGYVYHPEWSWIAATSPFQVEFMFGCFVAWLTNAPKETRFGWTAFAVGVAWYAASVYLNAQYGGYDPRWRAPLFGLASGFIIYGVVALELRKAFFLPRMMLPIGAASYSLYIWHQFIFFVCIYVTEQFGLFEAVPGPVLLIAWAAIAGLVAFSSYRLIELPTMKLINRLLGEHRRPLSEVALNGERKASLGATTS